MNEWTSWQFYLYNIPFLYFLVCMFLLLKIFFPENLCGTCQQLKTFLLRYFCFLIKSVLTSVSGEYHPIHIQKFSFFNIKNYNLNSLLIEKRTKLTINFKISLIQIDLKCMVAIKQNTVLQIQGQIPRHVEDSRSENEDFVL